MTTEARILANRLNAQKSTGPNTPQGKAVVSQNALKHGLSARHDVIITESQADFDLHRDALLAELHPQGPMESILADRIVSLSWRLKRADLIQNQTIDALHEESTAKLFPALTRLLTPENQDPDLILGRIALKDFSNERVLDRLLMYERRIEHSLYKTTLELQRLRLLRDLEPSEPNLEPEDRRLAPAPDPATPNPPNCNPAHAGIPIRQEPISQIRRGGINNQSSIVNIESPPEPGQNHPTSTILERSGNPLGAASTISKRSGDPLGGVSRIQHHYAKQTQFPKSQNQRNPLCYRDLPQYSAPHRPKKQTQTNPIPQTGQDAYIFCENTCILSPSPSAT